MQSDLRAPNRPAPTLAQRLNPLWWMLDTEKPTNWSTLAWFVRNPFCNFFSVIVGISHKTRLVHVARGTGWTFVGGINYGYSTAIDGWLPRPFVSYRGCGIECCIGWMTSGGYAPGTFRVANARQP